MAKRRYRFSIRLKLVFLVTILAVITFSMSALFIIILYDYAHSLWNITERRFIFLTLFMGIFWTGILAYFFAKIITKPLQKLEEATTRVAEGDLNQSIDIPTSDDEIRSLSIAFNTMLINLRNIVNNINSHFKLTHQSVLTIKEASQLSTNITAQITSSTSDISDG